MATTTNYGWTTPDDTALVKDGASAIRTLGTSIDTTVKALSPGTTSGDLDYYTSATTKARLAKGTASQVLAMNSGATAPEWVTSSSGGMTLLSTTNLSSTTTTISSINQTYTNLLVLVQNPYLSAAQEFAIRPNAVASCALGWRWYVGAGAIASTNHLRSELNLGTTTSAANVGYSLLINNYADTTYGKTFWMTGNADSTNTSLIKSGIINTASAITSIDFTTTSGVPTFSGGRVLIYGVK
jgi:hypothetical protein